VQPVASSSPATLDDQPVRLLLVRAKPGDLPWLAETIRYFMAPAEIVQVVGLGNALWRLGQERFDTILLDFEGIDARTLQRCRERIGDLASVPVLNLHDEPQRALEMATARRTGESRPVRQPAREPAAHRVTRLPWQRRPKRQHSEEVASAG
jgi:hypothetical protein